MLTNEIIFSKYLRISKKSSTFAADLNKVRFVLYRKIADKTK